MRRARLARRPPAAPLAAETRPLDILRALYRFVRTCLDAGGEECDVVLDVRPSPGVPGLHRICPFLAWTGEENKYATQLLAIQAIHGSAHAGSTEMPCPLSRALPGFRSRAADEARRGLEELRAHPAAPGGAAPPPAAGGAA